MRLSGLPTGWEGGGPVRSKRSVSEKLLSWPDLVLLVFFVAFLALALAGSLSPADGQAPWGPRSASERRASFGHRRAWRRCFGAPHARRRAPYRRRRCFHRRRRCRGRGSRVRREHEGQVRRCVIVPARSAAGHSFDTRGHGFLCSGLGSGRLGTMIVVTTAVSAPYIARYTRSLVRPRGRSGLM